MLYADDNGSTPLLPVIKEYLIKRFDSSLFANPNAVHSLGQNLKTGMEKCRIMIAEYLGAYHDQVIFTSGASEGISTIFHSVLSEKNNKNVILTTQIEHAAVSEALMHYQNKFQYQIIYLPLNSQGQIDIKKADELIRRYQNQIALCCVMMANNETGVVQPIVELAEIIKKQNIIFFSDTTQMITKTKFNFNELPIDFAVASSHKMGALPGSGLILAKDSRLLKPLIFGGGQEKELRGGTQNYLAIETMAYALDYANNNSYKFQLLTEEKLKFENNLKKDFPEIIIFGDQVQRLPGTSLISFPGLHSQAIQIELETFDIFVTTSAACSDNEPETSEVLKAMNIPDHIGRGVIRISLSSTHTGNDYQSLYLAIKSTYNKLRAIKAY